MTLRLLLSLDPKNLVQPRIETEGHGFVGRARHSVHAARGYADSGAHGVTRPTLSSFLSVSIRVYPWLKHAAAWMPLGLLLLTVLGAGAQTADDFFHGGAVNYLSNNIPKALEVVTNARALFPDDLKLKKLEELLKQQNQSQQQQQKDQPQKQDEKKDQQSKPDQKDEKKQQQEQSKEDRQKQDQQQSKSKPEEKKEGEPQQAAAHAMTPQEAKQLLDVQKGDEKVLQFQPQGEPKQRTKTLKDW